jgi:hypothetical protein
MLIGYLLGVMTMEGGWLTLEHHSVLPVILPVLVLGVPLYDAVSVICVRLYHRRSPFRADTSHLHHRLRRTGMTDKQTVLFIYLLALALGVNAVLLAKLDDVGGAVLLFQVCAVLGLVVLLERIIRKVVPGRGITAVPVRSALVPKGGNGGAELCLTGRARGLDARGCSLEPGTPLDGAIADLLAERQVVDLELRLEHEPADAEPIRLLCRVRGIEIDDSGAQDVRLEFLRVPGAVQARLDDAKRPDTGVRTKPDGVPPVEGRSPDSVPVPDSF